MFEVLHQEFEPICVPLDSIPAKEGYSAAYVNNHIIKENGGNFIATFRNSPEAKTLYQIIKASSSKWPDNEAAGEREIKMEGDKPVAGNYKFLTYKQYIDQIEAFGRGMLELGLKRGDKVGIYSSNSIWWSTIEFAASYTGITIVPVYDSLGPNAAEYIVNHAEIKALFTSKFKFEIAKDLAMKTDCIKHLILMADENQEVDLEGKAEFTNCRKVLEKGQNSTIETQPSEPEDPAIVMYTSGSTGTPKGCLLLEKNVVAGAAGFEQLGVSATTADTYISFLPLAHIYALVVELITFNQGCRIGYARGPIKDFTDDIKTLHPTIIVAVPRVLNRVNDAMNKKINEKPAFLQKIIRKIIDMKANATWSNRAPSLLLDNLILNLFRNELGGRLRLIVNGGAPINKDVFRFISATVTPNIIQGYGLTETSAGVAVQEAPAKDPTTVGPCGLSCMVRFRAVEGTDYDAKGEFPTGELLVKGPIVFSGYYKREDLTEEAFDDGWFCTGDVCRLTENREIRIIDRAKQLVKLCQGEYISLTNLSEQYGRSKNVSFIYVYASSQHDRPVALVVPDRDFVKKMAEKGIKKEDIPSNEECRKLLVDSLAETFTHEKMRGFEKIDKILIDVEEPSIENGLLTPSMKPQFNNIKKKYQADLDKLYE